MVKEVATETREEGEISSLLECCLIKTEQVVCQALFLGTPGIEDVFFSPLPLCEEDIIQEIHLALFENRAGDVIKNEMILSGIHGESVRAFTERMKAQYPTLM